MKKRGVLFTHTISMSRLIRSLRWMQHPHPPRKRLLVYFAGVSVGQTCDDMIIVALAQVSRSN